MTQYIQTTLPDPAYRLTDGGVSGAGSYGPGFREVKLSSQSNTAVDRSNSGKVIARSNAFHQWNIDINYNPMTKAEFRPVSSFLMQKRGGLIPFFVDLPQYSLPENTYWNTFLNTSTMSPNSTQVAGSTTILISSNGTAYSPSSHGGPEPGEIFTITDNSFSNAYKVYMITRVETSSDYATNDSSNPGAGNIRLTITPGLEKAFTTSATLNFKNAKFRVIMPNDVFEYSLNTENLYSFSLKLEEALA